MAAVAAKPAAADDQLADGAAAREPGQEQHRREMRELVDLLSKLNPSAKEFIPSSHSATAGAAGQKTNGRLSADAPVFISSADYYNNYRNVNGNGKDSGSDGSDKNSNVNQQQNRRRRIGYSQGRRRVNERARKAQREECIRRTVYVSDIDQHVTEQQLARLFEICGKVRDCRICGDPHSVLRFAFIEFEQEHGARAALSLGGTMLGYYPVRVLPSKTAILPVNPNFLPQSEDEQEMVARTVYCTNIDKKVTQTDVKVFFDSLCGEVSRLRLLGDHIHSTRIAFVEFVQAESAIVALNCSGMILGALPVRVSPSKTPVRPRVPRAVVH